MVKALSYLMAILLFSSCEKEAPKPARPSDDPRFEEMVGGSLFSSHDENQLLRNRALAGELERTFLQLNGVKTARVHLNLQDPSILSRDRDAKSRAAVLIVNEGGTTPSKEEIQRFASAAIPNLSRDRVSVLIRPPKAPEASLTTVGPFEVTTSSAGTLKLALSLLLGLTIVSALGLIAAGYRIRKLKKRVGG